MAVFFALALPAACGQVGDPAVPCDAMDLGESRAGMVVAKEGAPVLVLSDSPRPFVIVRARDPETGAYSQRRQYLDRIDNVDPSCDGDDCSDEPSPIESGSRVLVTGNGRFIVAIDRKGTGTWYAWEVDDAGNLLPTKGVGLDDGGSPIHLLASLRDSNTIITRDAEKRLLAVPNPRSTTTVELAEDFELKLVAVGSRHVVGRELIDDARERLVLVPVEPEEGHVSARDATALAVSPAFTQVEITADDEYVIATSGSGDDAETFVFDVDSGALADRFLGAAVIGARKLEAMAGLRASSPDGSHLAYRTPSGALALRELGAASSCLVRSSSAGDHSLAGFAADGMLYMQADADTAESHLFAFDTRGRRLTALDAGSRGHHLAGVPARLTDRHRPWAIGVRDGSYVAVQSDAKEIGIGAQAPVFVPRDDDGMWLADVERSDASRRMTLRRLLPRPSSTGRGFDFGNVDSSDALVEIADADGTLVGASLATMYPTESPCLATGAPGGWAFQCGSSSRQAFATNTPFPVSESPGGSLEDSQTDDPVDEPAPTGDAE